MSRIVVCSICLFLAESTTSQAASATEGHWTGTPWTGEPGTTENTADIMSRAEDYQRPPKLNLKTPKNRPRGRTNFENLLSSPDSPPKAGEPTGEPQPTAGQSSGVSFTGATLFDTQSFPPDSMGAVGPSQFIVAVNGRIRSFNKTTSTADGVLNVNPNVFFESVMTPPVTNNFTSDPRIRYDRLSGRWFIIIIDVPLTGGTINVPHLGNNNGANGYLDDLDYRLLAAHIRNGKLWTAANIAVDNTGAPNGTDTRMGIRWYELGGIATDDGTPALDSTQTFSVIVVARPLIESITLSNNLPIVDWTAINGQGYRLQHTPLLENPVWSDVSGDVIATGCTASKTDPDAVETNHFYRVRVLP